MPSKGPSESHLRVIEERKRLAALEQRRIRDRALKIFPHVCASCGREFSGKRLKELTVHHVDHDHKNNPMDGSNWMMLCVYCHDHEHERHDERNTSAEMDDDSQTAPSIFNQFAGLDDLFNSKKDEDKG